MEFFRNFFGRLMTLVTSSQESYPRLPLPLETSRRKMQGQFGGVL